MYTWAAHGMEKVGKVFVVGAEDTRGPDALGWERKNSVKEAVAAAREWMGVENAEATFWQAPPVGYVRVAVGSESKRLRIAEESECPTGKAKRLKREEEDAKDKTKRAAAAKKDADAKVKQAMMARMEQAKKGVSTEAKQSRKETVVTEGNNKSLPESNAPSKKEVKKTPGLNVAARVATTQVKLATADVLSNTTLTTPRGLATKRVERDMWLGSVTNAPAHLDGTLPGDQGFDPLGLGKDVNRLAWYQEAELVNGRWAMAAVVGICAAEAYGASTSWWSAGQAQYFLPTNALLAVQFSVMGVLELKRLRGFLATGESGVLTSFPFDPLRLNSDSNKIAEVKHARLGMLAFVGIVAQAVVYRVGPLAALRDHVEDPFMSNVAQNVQHIGQTFEQVASKM